MWLVLGAVTLGIWLYLMFARGAFWLEPVRFKPSREQMRARVVAVVPARDEAEVIARSIRSLLSQRATDLHVVLVDDGSSDRTAAIAINTAASIQATGRLTVLTAPPRPAGWTGKLWAVHQGMQEAERRNPEFVLMTDADIEHSGESVAELVALAQRHDLDLASLMALLHCDTFAERALIPAFVYFFFMLYPPAWIADPRSTVAGAAGGCMLLRSKTLFEVGGVSSIRHELIDDCAMARAVKSAGGRLSLQLTKSVRSIRPYRTFAEVHAMIARTAYTQLEYSPVLLIGTLAGLLITYAAPPLVAVLAPGYARLLGVAAWLGMCVTFVPMLRFYGRSILWAPLLPLIALFYSNATFYSAWAFYSGRGGQWKGRSQAISGS
ncbi:MAG TPA: glycosyltransferase [Bryobacteraceae bacterium]|nr:glycosyltransferase [Bryobacteraceae bacterium]